MLSGGDSFPRQGDKLLGQGPSEAIAQGCQGLDGASDPHRELAEGMLCWHSQERQKGWEGTPDQQGRQLVPNKELGKGLGDPHEPQP